MATQAKSAVSESAAGAASALSLDEARARIIGQLAPVAMLERVAVREALGRVLGEDVVSSMAVPAHTNSAMDGYALRGADLPKTGETTLHVVGQSFAGHPFAGEVQAGECVRIMTGAVLPRGADTVVIQEDVGVDGDGVRIGSDHRMGQHVRQAGEDLVVGATVLTAGRRVRAADLGLLASLGIVEVKVRRRLRVAFFSTGDELRSLGVSLGEGDIYDSNRYTLYGMLTRFGAEVLDLGVVRDEPAALREAFEHAGAAADVVMASSGITIRSPARVREVLDAAGTISFLDVRVKPCRPIPFGRLHGGAAFLGFSSNPLPLAVMFRQIARPALDHLAGAEPRLPLAFDVRARGAFQGVPGYLNFRRGRLEVDAAGTLTVDLAAPADPGIVRSMRDADCFIVLPGDRGPVEPGEQVMVEPFTDLE